MSKKNTKNNSPVRRSPQHTDILLRWLLKHIEPDGIIDTLMKRLDLATKSNFVKGLKYRIYDPKTVLVYQVNALSDTHTHTRTFNVLNLNDFT